MKRRQFTTWVTSLAALSALFGQAAFAALKLAPEQMMARGRFESLLGQQFMIRDSVVDIRLRLTHVKSAIRGHDEEQFNVMFDAPEGPVLPEGVYVLEAGGKTEFGLHLLPGGTMSGRQQMIASVNLQTAA
jgi:hypothetical protein